MCKLLEAFDTSIDLDAPIFMSGLQVDGDANIRAMQELMGG